jgi:hypothetical protein
MYTFYEVRKGKWRATYTLTRLAEPDVGVHGAVQGMSCRVVLVMVC